MKQQIGAANISLCYISFWLIASKSYLRSSL